MLCSSAFTEWSTTDPAPLRFDECVGFRIPLMLGGEDVLEDWERCSMEVYWSLCIQIAEQVKDLEPGTPINAVRLFDDE